MTIGFDGKRAVCNMTGLGNYSRLVLEELATAFPQTNIVAYTPRMRENARLEKLTRRNNVNFRLPVKHPLEPSSIWRTWSICAQMKAEKVDLYHGLSNELPLSIKKAQIPSVVTIHDIIYRRLPYCYSAIDRKIYDFKYGQSCKLADRIIAISECTKRDIIHYYGISEDKIHVIYQGCDPQFQRLWTEEERTELRSRLRLPNKYIVQVGTIEKRKNLELTVRALSALPQEIKLVVVGRATEYIKEVNKIAAETRVSDRIIYIHDATFKDLPGIYQCSEAIAYPSRYEGFGIPIIEGLESKRPVIAATGSCLEEAGGDAAIYVAPDDAKAMADALLAATNGTLDLNEINYKAERHTRLFDTSEMANKIASVYSELGINI